MQEKHCQSKPEKEAIHSGHFMVSHFEAEAQDDEDDVAVPVPETEVKNSLENIPEQLNFQIQIIKTNSENGKTNQQLSIETSLSKLFQCMSLAYRQKLTSPKWNRFRGIRLRWKDKIRLNNVIWRCWHMQFIMKQNTLICQFASPLDVDQHNKPEAVVLEGKYWKRKLQAVTAEYKKWRMYYRNQTLGCTYKDLIDLSDRDKEALSWNSQSNEAIDMLVDEDYMDFMSDTLFSTIGNQPFVFPDSREIAKAGLADFIQPSLGPLQPNLDDIMDTLEPLNELINAKLPSVPEEQGSETMSFKPMGLQQWDFGDYIVTPCTTTNIVPYEPIETESVKLAPYSSELVINYNEQTQHFNQTVIQTKTNAEKTKEALTQQEHIKMTPNQIDQSNVSVFKPVANYQNYQINDLNKAVILVNPEVQNVPTLQLQDRNSRGYKFAAPVNMQTNAMQNKFTAQVSQNSEYILPEAAQQILPVNKQEVIRPKEMSTVIKSEGSIGRGKNLQNRQRSRSTTREPHQRPPLLTAVSDPAIINTNSSSALLTQLLTTNNRRSSMTTVDTSSSSSSTLIKREEPLTLLPTAQTSSVTNLQQIITNKPSNSNVNVDNILMNTSSNSSLDQSSLGIDSPESPNSMSMPSMIGSPGCDSTSPNRDRRVGHIHAEQKRRYNIKNGFDMIHSLIPHLNQNPNAKLSKAAMLQRGADYIRQLRSERNQLKEEMDALRQQIECLNTSISNCQSMLPATGAPVSRRRDNKMQEMFDDYVKRRTLENWKFWIFSLMIKPLLSSYNNFVSNSSLEDLYRSTMLWIEQHCTLVDLRPIVLNSFRYLCTKTNILEHPERLPEEARQAVLSNTRPGYS